ncbi:hypothetical protein PLICRDRAFT_107685 [Plicaturopsis crispa FD-325 SS-3]|nr:hypothetical protein PLICRDRAFT_107685 [Plicaturopsis crispa FD-325 SS-3]
MPLPPNDHRFMPANAADSRSPCPALNALANHGYLPREGRDLGLIELVRAIRHVYNFSLPLALLVALAGVVLCGHGLLPRRVHLEELAAHNVIEHDASFAHADAPPGSRRAPVTVDAPLLRSLLRHAHTHLGMGLCELARARFERLAQAPRPLDLLHAHISFAEAALIWLTHKGAGSQGMLLVDVDDPAVMHNVAPVHALQQWLGEDRLPDAWQKGGEWRRPESQVGLLETIKVSHAVHMEVERLRLESLGNSPLKKS